MGFLLTWALPPSPESHPSEVLLSRQRGQRTGRDSTGFSVKLLSQQEVQLLVSESGQL